MKILSLKSSYVLSDIKYPVVSSVRKSDKIPFLTLEIHTNEGIIGVSYIQAFNKQVADATSSIVAFLEKLLIGKNPLAIEERNKEMWERTKLFGHSGIVTFAISLIDIALWDIKGKTYNQPVYRLLGGEENSFDAYASDGLWLTNLDSIMKQSEELVSIGFTSIKMRMGRKNIKEDIEILDALRNHWGNELNIMVDVNQGWNRKQAKEMLDILKKYNVYWVEEPLDTNDLEGYNQLTLSSKTPVCFGENIYGMNNVFTCLAQNTSNYFTPDLQRIGGITGWLKIAPILEYYRVPCAVHLFPEYAVHLMSTYPYSEKVEWMSWSSALFINPLTCENGTIKIPDSPGFGMNLLKN
ncbi:mandelate racemase/muconate lactonizing enzyme family protein [Sporosarcina sp. Marseille-Q4063]|uniref:mandelate racemase/muconate lactonizing enzyme family protein n=1 Tax=Sporosarcina sp. Marseille-Q4063 TaxID=2810514 RepID=UPI001BB0444B|nr:mandelate racemase/muconate lactonizing enzyme family protein [Sporosarcina sp. Marseille-Q4063]QUW21271.1 mandelate racemase/muconate lactonizing enzyme family protein [Sporosarcina sp. Marseille-Q4063]